MMGIFEGAYAPTSLAVIQETSSPQKRGFNTGIEQSISPLFGLGLAPIIADSSFMALDFSNSCLPWFNISFLLI
jgi:MFS family permease